MRDRVLTWAAIFFAFGFFVHNADHLRRGTDTITTTLFWAGNLAGVISIFTIVVVLMGVRWAPYVAIAAGFPLALGFAAAHVLPEWSALSDSFVDGSVSAFSWFAAMLEIAGALALGFAGIHALRHDVASTPIHARQ
jgi:hypothetical protein